MILPNSHHVSVLIVRYYHCVLGHAGREHVLSIIRQCFWILRGRVLVREILSSCVNCRRRNSPPLQQVMAVLPKERLIPYQPQFTYTGLDFFWTVLREAKPQYSLSVWLHIPMLQ